jgi:hypothetical protein
LRRLLVTSKAEVLESLRLLHDTLPQCKGAPIVLNGVEHGQEIFLDFILAVEKNARPLAYRQDETDATLE